MQTGPSRWIVGVEARTVKAAAVMLVLAAASSGCFWRTYGRLAATHVEVLTGIARKGADLVAAGRLTAESMPELTYPLERAQAFARKAAARSGDARPASLAAFEVLLARYRAYIDTLDRVRREVPRAGARDALAGPLGEVEAAGAAVLAALRAEGRL
jgi:hypothetical protein